MAGTREEIILWDLATRKLLRQWASRNNYQLVFSRDGSTLASSGAGTIHLWDSASGRPFHSWPGHEGEVASVAFSPNGKYLVSISWSEKALRLWETATGRELQTLRGHIESIRSIAFSPDGTVIASGSWDGTLRLWDGQTGEELAQLKLPVGKCHAVAFSN